MSTEFRRFEILLPMQFNDGTPVPVEMVVAVELELEQHFGSISSETQIIRGRWQHEGHSYCDNMVRLFIDVADTTEKRQFFRDYKAQLKERFQQKDIWITSHLLDIY